MNKKQRLTYQIGKREYKKYTDIFHLPYSLNERARFIRQFQSCHSKHSMEYMRNYNRHYFGGNK